MQLINKKRVVDEASFAQEDEKLEEDSLFQDEKSMNNIIFSECLK